MIPIVPPGSTLRSFVNALLHMRGDLRATFVNHSGMWGAQAVALQLLEGRRSALWVARQFTTFPMVVSTLTEDQERGLLFNLALREPNATAMDFTQSVLPRVPARFRVCRLCIEADLSQYGLGFTRVLHQIPSVRVCVTHDHRLEHACADCGLAYSLNGPNPRRRALDRCSACRSEKGLPIDHAHSEGRAAFANLVSRGLGGQAPEVRPDHLHVALQRFAELSVERGEDLLWMLSRFWGVKTWTAACACIGAKSDDMRRSLLFGAPPASVLGAYGLASFYHSSVKDDPDLPTGNAIDATIWSFMSGRKEDERLFDMARRSGIPTDIALLLMHGDWIAIRTRGYSLKDVRRFVKSLQDVSLMKNLRQMHLQRARKIEGAVRLRSGNCITEHDRPSCEPSAQNR